MRMAFEWFEEMAAAGSPCKPIIVDADDLISDPGVARKLAGEIGGDAEELIFEWEAVEGEELEGVDAVARVYESTLLASRGVVEGKRAGDLYAEIRSSHFNINAAKEERARQREDILKVGEGGASG